MIDGRVYLVINYYSDTPVREARGVFMSYFDQFDIH